MVAGSYAFLSSSIPYITAREAQSRPGQKVHVAGEIVRGADPFTVESGVFEFDFKDPEAPKMHVLFHAKPANFKTTSKVSVAGCYDKGWFVPDQILVKCPSKYESMNGETEPPK